MASLRPALALLLVSAMSGVHGYRTGAPSGRCGSMQPGHVGSGQTGTPPFTVSVSADSYNTTSQLTVGIQANAGFTFKGFLLQARRAGDPATDVRFGLFTPVTGTKLQCGTGGLTHDSRDLKTAISVNWSTVSDQYGDIVFRATVVQSYNTWYEQVDSSVIRYVAPTTAAPPTSPTTTSQQTTTRSTTPPPSATTATTQPPPPPTTGKTQPPPPPPTTTTFTSSTRLPTTTTALTTGSTTGSSETKDGPTGAASAVTKGGYLLLGAILLMWLSPLHH